MSILKIDPQTYASQGAAVLGIRDSGKSYTATKIAETLFDAGIPFVAFDPIGIWRFLRVPGKGKGYPVVVAGGEEGDLPLTPASAAAIVRAAMQNGVSLVIDLFDPHLSKADWKRIVEASIKTLLFENKEHGLRHIFIEEAAEFIPQIIPKDGVSAEVYSIIERLVRMGGNRRLGYTLINQRAEQVNKAVLELCDNLFLHRQKGKNSITSLGKWLAVAGVENPKALIDSLPTLPQGECWTWLAGQSHATRIKVPAKNSFHPDRLTLLGDAETKMAPRVDAAKFVSGLKSKLVVIEEEAKANDPKALKAEIARLNSIIAKPDKSGALVTSITHADVVAARDKAFKDGLARGHEQGFKDGAREMRDQYFKAWEAAKVAMGDSSKSLPAYLSPTLENDSLSVAHERITHLASGSRPTPSHPGPVGKITATAPARANGKAPPIVRKILRVIHNAYPMSLSFAAAAARAGASRRSSAYGDYEKQVLASGEVNMIGGRLQSAPGFAEPVAQTGDPLDIWAGRLPPSYGRMLRAIAAGEGLSPDQIAECAEVSRTSSGLSAGLKELLALSLVEVHNGIYYPSEALG